MNGPTIRALIKSECEDFEVEEIPAYEPNGEGEHLYLWVEKRDASAAFALRQLSRYFGVRERDIGSAGNKDRRAVTRQYYSLLARDVDPQLIEAPSFEISRQLRVLKHARHPNKLRRGHLRGNRFRLRVALPEGTLNGDRDAIERELAERLRAVEVHGVVNLYGAQRFGHNRETERLGLEMLIDAREGKIRRSKRDRFVRRLALNAAQSAVFNLTIERRLALDGGQERVRRGDVLERRESGGRFVCEDADLDQARFERGELSLTGPMHGPKMIAPGGEVAELEREALEHFGLVAEDFSRFHTVCSGARRVARIFPEAMSVSAESAEAVRINFSLPSGSYATVVLGQIFDEIEHGHDVS